MITVYNIVYLERKIIGATAGRPVPQEMRTRIINEYKMRFDPERNTYRGDPDQVWEVLKKKYPIQTAKFKSYDEIFYKYKYGSVPASSLKWYTKEEIEKLDREPDPRRIRIHD